MADQKDQQKLLKFTVQHYKDANVTDEEFSKWYLEVHRPRMVRLVHKHNVARYALYLTPSSLRAAFQEDLDKFRGAAAGFKGWQMADFDVTTTYWVRNPDELRNMLADPEWDEQVQKPENGWIDQDRASIQVGWENVYVEDGQIIEPKE
ncbi:hypothetical protein GGR56DRAFT_682028 [Xylariaceae sp. FL0804]|nr:hypothetical protein GGR56DRAFT_682028 [Xylariaceae sp. FL0804]